MNQPAVSFVVYGDPKPKGSYRVVPNKRTGEAVLINDAKGAQAWVDGLVYIFQAHYYGDPIAEPVEIALDFCLRRPKSVRRIAHTVKPDLDKLQRLVLDALVTAKVLRDDAIVWRIEASKRYEDDRNLTVPGVEVTIWITESTEEAHNEERKRVHR